jgi:hypothetical protein
MSKRSKQVLCEVEVVVILINAAASKTAMMMMALEVMVGEMTRGTEVTAKCE